MITVFFKLVKKLTRYDKSFIIVIDKLITKTNYLIIISAISTKILG